MLLISASEGNSLILFPLEASLQGVKDNGVAFKPTKKATDSAWHDPSSSPSDSVSEFSCLGVDASLLGGFLKRLVLRLLPQHPQQQMQV